VNHVQSKSVVILQYVMSAAQMNKCSVINVKKLLNIAPTVLYLMSNGGLELILI